MTHDKEQLIIFTKNPEKGKVKTRLARTIGDKEALLAYKRMLQHTENVCRPLQQKKVVYYSSHLDTDDIWDESFYEKQVQSGHDLGARMENAFQAAFNNGYTSVVIIGSDCLELTTEILSHAFDALLTNDIVIGPAHDGGYYLLGMKTMHSALFNNKQWSAPSVFSDTLRDIKLLNLSIKELAVLHDIDLEKDLQHFLLN